MTAPMRSCAAAPAPSPSESGRSMTWSPSAALRLARPPSPADRRARAQAVLPQPSGSRFQTHWFLYLLFPWHIHKTVPEPFSYPARRFLHARDLRRLHSLHRCSTHPVNGHRPRGWTSDLFSSQPRPELGGSPVESCLHPWR
jgi:hypothetical protein